MKPISAFSKWLFTLWDVCYFKPAFLCFCLIMSSGGANCRTASSEVLWLLASVCIWPMRSPWQGIERLEEKAWDTLPQLPSNKVISWRAEYLQPASSRHLQQAQLAWFLLLVPPLPLQVEEAENNLAIAVSSLVGFWILPLGNSRPVIKLFLIVPFLLISSFLSRTPAGSPVSFNLYPTSLTRWQKINR